MRNNNNLAANNGSWVCQPNNHYKSRGVFFGDNPLSFGSTVLLAQLSLSSLLTNLIQWVLTPLGESSFISQMLVGLALGPSFYGENQILEAIFPFKSFYVSETFAFFGCMVFMFLVGVKMDLTMVARSGKKAMVIGFLAFASPMLLNYFLSVLLKNTVDMDAGLNRSLIAIGAFQSSSSFHVIACLLTDLKLLNSDIGRLALSSSMISGTLSWIGLVVGFTMRQTSIQEQDALPWMALCVVCMVIMVVYILRPVMTWIVAQTNRTSGCVIKESYVFWVFLMLLFCALFSEVVGQHFMMGPMILGLAVPDGPPLGSALVDRLDSFVSGIMLPCYFVISGARINLTKINMRSVGIIHVTAFGSFVGKMIGTVLPSLYCKMPLGDSLTLGLIMSTQGIADILILQHAMLLYMIDQKSYSMMVVAMMVVTGTISPIVKIIYNPSRKYKCNVRRRTIEHTSPSGELRLLLCIHHQDNTPSIINLLHLSNPTIKSPICFYLVHLLELSGRASPLLINHHDLAHRNSKRTTNISDQIIHAFQLYQEFNRDKVIMNAFTSVAPFATMHDDVCMLALEKRVAMVIVPFHKRRTINGGFEESANAIRGVNKNILSRAPCSVGILIDRVSLPSTASVSLINKVDLYKVGMLFVEGPDDREALAYATRMAEQSMVSLTVVQLTEPKRPTRHEADQDLDRDMINEFKTIMETNSGMKHCFYEEELVSDCVGMINVIRTMEHKFDLILVGRRHDGDSALFMGLNEWNEYPELGFIGDMFASSDSSGTVAVLVVQQQTIGGDQEFLDDFRCIMEESFAVDIKPLIILPDTWAPSKPPV